jgi:putative CocE/NonD family hydrolase
MKSFSKKKKETEMKIWKFLIPILAVVLLIAVLYFLRPRSNVGEKVSGFGQYQGYSAAVYDGWQRTSDYLALSDGTQLAYDLFLPTKKGVPATTPLPVLFKYTPYDRAWNIFDPNGKAVLCELYTVKSCELMLRFRALVMPHGSGKIKDAVSRTEWLGDMLKSGYAVVVVDRPGTGASFGKLDMNPETVVGETDQLLDWIAAQPWSDGNVGMFGDSIQAQVQFQAASSGNPHLKAILPATTWMDNYSAVMFPGGIPDTAFTDFYIKANQVFDQMATPVDRDTDGTLLARARAERQGTSALSRGAEYFAGIAFRDSVNAEGTNVWTTYNSLYPLLDKINRSGIAVYLINGWYDLYARDDFLIYNNLTVPKRLLVRPTDHSGIEAAGKDVDYGAEAHRWFDYWLKGIDNGIMDEAPIHYYLQGAPKGQEYQSAEAWPLDSQEMNRYYFAQGDPAGKASVNDGAFRLEPPAQSPAFDAYTVDYSTTSGTSPLWSAPAMPHKYPNMRSNDAKALTYTTPPLQAAMDLAGHPLVHLWLSTNAPDLDAFVYLEEVDGRGNSTYITEGSLRASHRALGQPSFDSFGLPWRDHYQSKLQPLPAGEPVELVFDLRPTAWHFSAGKQIRLTVAFADAGNFETPVLTPAPSLQVLQDAAHPSCVELPLAAQP